MDHDAGVVRYSGLIAFAGVIVAVCVAVGCGSSSSSQRGDQSSRALGVAAEQVKPAQRDPILRHIPANTPYFLGGLEALPADFLSRELRSYGPAMDALLESMFDMLGDNGVETADLDGEIRLAVAFFEELRGKLTATGMAELGIGADVRMAIYGVGLVPALRVHLANGERFRALIERVAARAKQTLSKKTLRAGEKAVEYWQLDRVGGSTFSLVVAVVDNQLVAGFIPSKARDAVLPILLGTTLPSPSLAETNVLQQIVGKYKLARWNVVLVNLASMANILVGRGTQLDLATARALGASAAPPACRHELPALIDAIPRLVGGSYQYNAKLSSGLLVLETRADFGDALAAAQGAIPATSLTEQPGIKLAIGMGIDLHNAIEYAATQLEKLKDEPFACPWLAGFNELASDIDRGTLSMLPAITGLNTVLHEFDLDGMKLEGALVIASDEPQKLMSTVGIAIPGLGNLQLQPGSGPVPLPGGLISPTWSPAFAAMSHDGLGLATGPKARVDLERGFSSEIENTTQALLSMRLDRSWWEMFKRQRERLDEAEEGIGELSEALDGISRVEAERYGDTLVTCAITSHGLMIEMVQHYKE